MESGFQPQTITYRGFVDARGVAYPQEAANDAKRAANEAGAAIDAATETIDVSQTSVVSWELGLEDRGVVVTGRPNREVLAAIAASDFVIDQVYSDSPLAGFAAEAAALGRPAIVGGYAWDDLRRVTPAEVMPPSHVCRPEDLADAIRRLFDGKRLKAKEVATSLSGNAVIVKKITLPVMTESELSESIYWEAEQYIPFDIQDVNLDYQILDRGTNEDPEIRGLRHTAGADIGDAELDSDSDSVGTGEHMTAGRDPQTRADNDIRPDRIESISDAAVQELESGEDDAAS